MDRIEQSTMTFNPRNGVSGEQIQGVFRGKILPNGVRHRDVNGSSQTLVNLYMYDLLPPLTGVPTLTPKINSQNGEYMDPEPGDLVAVAFFGGNMADPVVIGYLPPANNTIQSLSTEAPRYHRRRNGTDEKIEKDGSRIVYVAKDDTLEVVGNGTITVHGNVTVHVYGTATVNVDGNTTVTTPNATVHSSGQIQFDTPLTTCTGNLNVNGGITCTGTYGSTGGKIQTPGDIKSTGGQVGDSVRNISQDRAIYNGHTHGGIQPGSGNTAVPTQQE